MNPRAFNRNDAVLNEATKAVTFRDVVRNVASLDCTLVVPTASHRRAALVEWTRHMRGGTPPNVFTLSSYARHVLTTNNTDVRILGTSDAALLLRYAARSTNQRLGNLDFSIERLLRWKAEGITANALQEKADDEFAPRFVRILSRFARVWHTYELIKGQKGADRVDMIVQAARSVVESPLTDERVVVWGLHKPTQVESVFLQSLGVHASVAIVWAPSSNAAMVRERTQDIIAWGWEQDVADIARVDNDGEAIDGPIHHTARKVYRESTRLEESRRILFEIKHAVASGSVDINDVAIISAGSAEYKRYINDRAIRAGIPIAIQAQRALHTTGVALALRAACDVASGGWRYADLERLLRSGFVVADSVNTSALLHAGTAHRIQGGSGAEEWSRALRHRRDVLRRVLEHDDNADIDKRAISELDAAMRAVAWMRTIIDAVPAPISAPAFARLLGAFLQRLGIARTASHLESVADDALLPCAEREALVAIEALTERYAVLSQDLGVPMMTLSEHTLEWWELVRAADVRTPDVRLDGIPILTAEEARGRTFRLVFAPGFVEGEFPVREDDPLEAEILPDVASRKYHAAFDDIMNAVSSDGAVIVTYPKEVDDAEVLPSSFLRGHSIEAPTSDDYVLDAHEHAAQFGKRRIDNHELGDVMDVTVKGLRDVKVRQRGALPDVGEMARTYVADIVNVPLSASRLDQVAACPYKFFASRILRLDVSTDTEDTLSGIERGAMMHDVARRFYERIRGRAVKDVASVDELLAARVELEEVHRHEYMSALLEIYNDVSVVYDTDHTYAETERRSIIGTPERPGLLYRWLAHELKQQASVELRPALFEFDLSVVVDGEAVRGRVDRIDVAPYQTPTGTTGVLFSVIDYKTQRKSAPTKKNVLANEATQMPLYVSGVLAAFNDRGIEATPSQAIYRTFGKSMKVVEDPSDRAVLENPSQEQLQQLFHAMNEHVKDMRASAYPVAPLPTACKRCNYQDVCRIASWGTVNRT